MVSTTSSVTDLGADVLLFEQLLDPTLCSHIMAIAECCQFEQAGIELTKVKTQIPATNFYIYAKLILCCNRQINYY